MVLDNFRTQKIIWDRANKKIFETIEANSGDSNGRKLVVQIINQEANANLSGTTLSLGWKSRKGAKGLDAFNLVDASKGIFEIYYTTEMLSNIGNLEASLILIDSTGRIESSTFTISVRPSTVDDESVESENSFTALTEALVKVSDIDAQLAQTKTELRKKANQSSLEAERSRIDNLIKLPEGSTANDARLEDIRIGTDGTVYSSPGTAVRNQLNEKADYYNMEHLEEFELGWVDKSGNEIPSTTRARSIVYKLPAGSTVRLIRSDNYMLGINTSTSEKIPHFESMFYAEKVYERVITKEQPFVRIFISKKGAGELDLSHALSEISSGVIHRAIYENDLDDVVREDRLAEKADLYKAERVEDFELGYVDRSGKEIDDITKARSSVYKLPEGSIVRFNRPSNYLFGYQISSRPDNISHGAGLFFGEQTIERSPTTKEQPYIRFFITSFDGKQLDLSQALGNGFIEIVRYRVAYEGDLLELSERLKNIPSSGGISTNSNFNSTYRTPSRAEGGVVTFIDDDGKKGVYDILYPLFKRKNAPFGIAIVTDWIDGREDVMTLEQLKEIASDREIIEVMNHTKTHPSLDSTDEAFIHEQVGEAKKWFAKHGFDATGLVLPYGGSNKTSQNIIQQYYNACYDFGNYFPESFDNIRNQLIVRDSWDYSTHGEDPLEGRKRLVDQAAAENKWLIITTHVGNSPTYWNDSSESGLEELIDYIQSKGIKILSPKEGFQTFGNLIENDNGFKIQANGKIVGAK